MSKMNGRMKWLSSFIVALVALSVSLGVFAAPQTVVLLHTNDMHGRLEAYQANDKAGGLTQLATMIKGIRSQYPGQVLLLDGGDAIHGTNIVTLFGGESMVEAMNAVGYNVATFGNHEFNYGQPGLLQRVAQAQYPYVSANITYAATGDYFTQPYAIFAVDGLKVGVFGLATPDTPIVTHPKNVEGLVFGDPQVAARAAIQSLQGQVDLIVALSHLGYDADQKLVAAVPDIDVIVGGHSHTLLSDATKVGNTLIVQDGELAGQLGMLKVSVENGQVVGYEDRILPVTADTPQDAAVQVIAQKWSDALTGTLGKDCGETAVVLDGERANVRTKETNLGNLVTDVMRLRAGTDIAVNNGGGIRASIDVGPITLNEVYTVLPFDNSLVVIRVTGADIKAALEVSVGSYPEQNGGFLQVSGLSFTFDPTKPAGQRVIDVKVGDQPLNLEREYTLATNDFTAAGGDGYTVFAGKPHLVETGEMLRDAVAEYLKSVGIVNLQVEGRIKALN